MATASAKKVAPQTTARRSINQPLAVTNELSTTKLDDSGDIVQGTEPDKISLSTTSAVEYEEKVTVVAPKSFTLTRDDGAVVQYHAGTQEMPVSDAAHWFTRAMGVKVYAGTQE